MKKLVCLLAVLALASVASANVDVIKAGIFQNAWAGGTNSQDYSGGNWVDNVSGPGGVTVAAVDATTGWTNIRTNLVGTTATTDITGNNYLEYVVYYDTDSLADYSECFDLTILAGTINGAKQFKDQLNVTLTDMATSASVTGARYNEEYSIWGDGGKWVHVSVNLQDNNWGVGGSDLTVTGVGALHVAGHNHSNGSYNTDIHAYISDMTFSATGTTLVPEPATMALLGLGGLALIRRKR